MDLSSPVKYSNLEDKNVLITGGASGLGKAFVRMFASSGANVVAADMNEPAGQEFVNEMSEEGSSVTFVHVDVSSWKSLVAMFRKALEHFPNGEIDILVTSAGIFSKSFDLACESPAALEHSVPAEPPRAVETNLIGTYQTVQLAVKYGMGLHNRSSSKGPAKNASKCIVVMGSMASYSGTGLSADYTASKWGIRGLFRNLRKPLIKLGVRINLLAPFYVDTPMTTESMPGLQQAGLQLAKIEDAVEAVARIATDYRVAGRAIAVWHDGLQDLKDDVGGSDASLALSQKGGQYEMFVRGAASDRI